MAEYVDELDDGQYSNKVFDKMRKELNEMVLIRNFIPVIIIALYLVTLKVGTLLMKERQAFKLKTVLRVYNLIQVIVNSLVFVPFFLFPSVIPFLWEKGCKLTNADVDNILSDGFSAERNAFFLCCWFYLLLKIFDLLDTVFMVLRKKNSHITFLHLYHHVSMVLFLWYTYKYSPGFQGVVFATINAIVHVIMYTYFFLSTFGPSVRKCLWWKRYLTKIQMAQFVLVLLYTILLFYNGCDVSKTFMTIWIFNVAVIFSLFSNFYIKTYLNKAKVTPTFVEDKNK